jgi:hypothetical protein
MAKPGFKEKNRKNFLHDVVAGEAGVRRQRHRLLEQTSGLRLTLCISEL